MTKRKALSKRIRFEVFKRDSFTCQYCGRKAPEVVLQVDHIEPRAEGGEDSILNLVTSCADCNSGKGATTLDDSAALARQHRQLAELQERREQLEMMVGWQRSLMDMDATARSEAERMWKDLTGWSLSDHGSQDIRVLVRKYGLDEAMTAMRIAADQYLKRDDGGVTEVSVEYAFRKLGGICYNRRRAKEDPAADEADRIMWSFVRKFRSQCSHYPANWRLCKWWKALVDVRPDADPADVVEEILENYANGAGGAYFDGALEILDA